METPETIRVLLVEDDEDDYIITRGVVAQIKGCRPQLEWFNTYQRGLDAMLRNRHDICLVDYRLGAKNGIDLLREASQAGCQAPVILLTGLGQHEVDVEAMKAGAADYLVKASLQADALERAIRYALERKRAASQAAFEQASLAAFGAEVGLALTKSDSLVAILTSCADAAVRYLNVHLARIWVHDATEGTMQPMGSAGAVNGLNDRPYKLDELGFDADSIKTFKPGLHNIAEDPFVPSPEWAAAENVVACAHHPLMLEDRLIGVMSIYSTGPLPGAILQQMGSVAHGIALCIERKRSDERLDAYRHQYHAVMENIKEVVFQVNEFGHWTSLNPAWTELTGFSVKEAMGSLFLEFVHHDDRQRNSLIFMQLIERKIDYCRHETRFLTKDGKIRWMEVYAQLTLNSDGSVLGASGSLTDITDRKQAETQIQRLAAFPQVNPNPVLEFDADGRLTYFNDAARDMAASFGHSDPLAILPPNATELVRQCVSSATSRLREMVSLQNRTLSWSFFPISGTRVVHCYGTDITEMLTLEAQFRHAQKLESVGQLAAGVAHDFNNILTVIQGYSDLLLVRFGSDADAAGPLRQIGDAARRASGLTRQLLTFSRKQVIQPRRLDLNAVLRNLSNMLTRLLGEDIAIVANYADTLPGIEADAGMMEQVIMNLAVNSRDAMPKGGQLRIDTAAVEVDAEGARRHPKARPGAFVRLTVADTGCGMDGETLGRIFEPFFSTKEVGKGTGLGLATVYGIVTQHQGWIDVSSKVGTGTTFQVYLPAATEPAPAAEPATEGPGPVIAKGRNETILLVEDEPILREWVKQVLVSYTYNVVEAGTGVEALKVWDEQTGRIDLLLTDMVMPEGMTGRDLAKQLRSRAPALKVIFTSGYSAEILANDEELPGIPFLPKPYQAPRLVQLVRDCLDAKSGNQPAQLVS
jgi:two-component system cell cycle sensor histidine kinase/response regulator CckA